MNFQTLNLLFQCSKEFGHKKIRSHDLSDTAAMVCSYVHANKGCSQDDVVEALRIHKTTIAKAAQKLEDQGLICRIQDSEDKRKKNLSVTPKGAQQLSDIMDLHEKWFSSILSCLSEAEQLQFESYCTRLLHTAEELNASIK